MNDSRIDSSFWWSYRYIKRKSGRNDGLVSVRSAEWGNNITMIEGVSHNEILDIRQKAIGTIHIPELYLNMIKSLSEMGY
jgi:hypothetical protein